MFKYEFFESNEPYRIVVENLVVRKLYLLIKSFYCRLVKKMYFLAA